MDGPSPDIRPDIKETKATLNPPGIDYSNLRASEGALKLWLNSYPDQHKTPQGLLSRVQLAETFRLQRQTVAARRIAEDVLTDEPENPKAHAILGTIAVKDKRYATATEHFTSALAADANQHAALLFLKTDPESIHNEVHDLTILPNRTDAQERRLSLLRSALDYKAHASNTVEDDRLEEEARAFITAARPSSENPQGLFRMDPQRAAFLFKDMTAWIKASHNEPVDATIRTQIEQVLRTLPGLKETITPEAPGYQKAMDTLAQFVQAHKQASYGVQDPFFYYKALLDAYERIKSVIPLAPDTTSLTPGPRTEELRKMADGEILAAMPVSPAEVPAVRQLADVTAAQSNEPQRGPSIWDKVLGRGRTIQADTHNEDPADTDTTDRHQSRTRATEPQVVDREGRETAAAEQIELTSPENHEQLAAWRRDIAGIIQKAVSVNELGNDYATRFVPEGQLISKSEMDPTDEANTYLLIDNATTAQQILDRFELTSDVSSDAAIFAATYEPSHEIEIGLYNLDQGARVWRYTFADDESYQAFLKRLQVDPGLTTQLAKMRLENQYDLEGAYQDIDLPVEDPTATIDQNFLEDYKRTYTEVYTGQTMPRAGDITLNMLAWDVVEQTQTTGESSDDRWGEELFREETVPEEVQDLLNALSESIHDNNFTPQERALITAIASIGDVVQRETALHNLGLSINSATENHQEKNFLKLGPERFQLSEVTYDEAQNTYIVKLDDNDIALTLENFLEVLNLPPADFLAA